MVPGPRVLYIALDACDRHLVEQLVAQGRCPTLGGLLDSAAVVETVAPYGSFVGSTWMTIATGCEVGTHRYYNWVEFGGADYHNRVTSPTEARRPPFWQQLSDRGQRVAVFDVPHSQVPDHLDGVLVKEWGCHDRHHGTGSFPAELLDELHARVGPHPYGSCAPPGDSDQFAPCDYTLRDGPLRTVEEERQLYRLIQQGVTAKAAASTALLDDGAWDLFMTVVGESHCVGHQLWHVHDTTHPRHDPATRVLLGDPVEEIYERLDQVVSEHLARADDDTAVYVHLSHGMQAHHDGDHLLDAVLDRLDQAAEVGVRTRLARAVLDRAPGRGETRLSSLAAIALRRRVAASPPAALPPARWRAERRFFQIPNNTVVGGIRLNVIGREREGLVAPADVEAVRADITAALLRLINIGTGRPAVLAVVPSETVLERSPDDAFPDLFVEWDRRAPVEQLWSPEVGTVAGAYDHWRTGDHHDRGLLLVRAPGVAPGWRSDPLSLVDLAPTLTASLGLSLDAVDGRARSDLVSGAVRVGPGRTMPRPRAPQPAPPARANGTDPRRLGEGAVRVAGAAARRSDEALDQVDVLTDRLRALEASRDALARSQQVLVTMRWLELQPADSHDLVSVITPTYDRPDQLRRAIHSVLAQRHRRWEMVVVDDGSDTAKSVVAEVGDDRVRTIEIEHGGPAAARNAGLAAAQGSIITYLDDDNILDPGWLQAVAWAFANHPDDDVLYGARLIDDELRVHAIGEGGWPWLQLNAFDRSQLLKGNIADMGVMAHRAGLPEVHFDERLWEYADWDLFLTLTEDREPLMLPAIAVHYRTDGLARLSGAHCHDEDLVLEKWAARQRDC